MRTAGGNMNHVTPAYKVGDVVEITEHSPFCSLYVVGQLVRVVSIDGEIVRVQDVNQLDPTQYMTSTWNIKHPATEGYPEQARVEQGYWTGQTATDEIDTQRSLNDATPDEWDQASKAAMLDIEHVLSEEEATETDIAYNNSLEDGDFDEPDLNIQAANPLDTQIGGRHYRDMEIQPIEFITANKLGWCEGHVVKYVSRHASKGGKQDLEKAKHYIDMLIGEVYGDE